MEGRRNGPPSHALVYAGARLLVVASLKSPVNPGAAAPGFLSLLRRMRVVAKSASVCDGRKLKAVSNFLPLPYTSQIILEILRAVRYDIKWRQSLNFPDGGELL